MGKCAVNNIVGVKACIYIFTTIPSSVTLTVRACIACFVFWECSVRECSVTLTLTCCLVISDLIGRCVSGISHLED